MNSLRIEQALGFWARLRGLIARPSLRADQALLLPRCRSIHTFFMSAPIDVVFLDRFGRVQKIVESLPPWRISVCARGEAVLELPANEARRRGWVRGLTIEI